MAATTTTTTAAAAAAAAAARSEGNFLPNLEGCGFNFDLSLRNSSLQERGHLAPKATSTGTTIAGILFKDGVVLGADTRATGGSMVFDKNCEKIHHLSRLMYCCGAGTAADTENVTSMISSQLELHRLSTGKEPRVITALTMLKQHLFKYQGHIGAALVLGGVDAKGAHLFTVAPHGSTDKLPYVTMGSGSLAAMAVFESGWRKDLPLDDAVQLVVQSIESGIFNDLGSGSNVDICVITKEGVDYRRNYVIANPRPAKQLSYKFPIGTTEFLQEKQQIDVMEIEQS